MQVPDAGGSQSAGHDSQILQVIRSISLDGAAGQSEMARNPSHVHRRRRARSQSPARGAVVQPSGHGETLRPNLPHRPSPGLLHNVPRTRIQRRVKRPRDHELIPVRPQLARVAQEHLVAHELQGGGVPGGGDAHQHRVTVGVHGSTRGHQIVLLQAIAPRGRRHLGRCAVQRTGVLVGHDAIEGEPGEGDRAVGGGVHIQLGGNLCSIVEHPFQEQLAAARHPVGHAPSHHDVQRSTVRLAQDDLEHPSVAPVRAHKELVVRAGLHHLVEDEHKCSSLIGNIPHAPSASQQITVCNEPGRREGGHYVQGGGGEVYHALHGHVSH
mmetsp:Transcript_8502/g.21294  ORF Transcript_8502/g.21294 Transcript_8502/m.21294 type:complete len:325 (-) Transcript_8502:3782-4756(-)